MWTPFLQLDRKMAIIRGFSKMFSKLLDFKVLILIEFPNIFHWKPAKKIKVGVALGENLG